MSDRLVAATKCDQYLNVRIFLPTLASLRLCVRFFSIWRLGVRADAGFFNICCLLQ
jgi:hypothetical protein